MEEDQNSEVQEVTPQDSESNAVENSSSTEESQPIESPHEAEDKQERNWKEARRKQRDSDVKLKQQEEMIEKLLNARQAPEPMAPEPDEFANISPDDYPTWNQTDRRIAKQAEAISERKFKELEAKKERERFLERLQSKYSDFNNVVNPDSIATLEENEPELAATIADLKDPFKMGMQTYKFIKALDMSGDISDRRHAKEVESKIKKNEKIVQSPQSYDKRPMAQVFQNNSAAKTATYEEMMGYASGSGY